MSIESVLFDKLIVRARPLSKTIIRSASLIVLSLWAMAMTVRPLIKESMALRQPLCRSLAVDA